MENQEEDLPKEPYVKPKSKYRLELEAKRERAKQKKIAKRKARADEIRTKNLKGSKRKKRLKFPVVVRNQVTIRADYLKYLRVILVYIKKKHDLNQSQLDTLFFLYSETYFTKQDFYKYARISQFNFENKNVKFFIERGLVEKWRETAIVNGKVEKELYRLTFKARMIVSSAYAYLNQEKTIMTDCRNPLMSNIPLNDGSKTPKETYEYLILKMNEEIKNSKNYKPHARTGVKTGARTKKQ